MSRDGDREPLPLARPAIGEREEELVLEALRSGRLSIGPMLERFEHDFAQWVGAPEAVAVSSGTAALHLCVRALGWGRGDRVATTPFSFVASANCLLYEGAVPDFCDIDSETLNLNPETVADSLDRGAAGVLPVHIFGTPVDAEIRRMAARSGVRILEDACEALGAVDSEGRRIGSGPDPATFAFYANKQVTTGEGGMVTCADPDFAARLRSERNQGRGSNMEWLEHERLGFNYRLSEIACALGIAQLEKIDRLLTERESVAAMYAERLAAVPGVEPLAEPAPPARRSWFVYVVRLDVRHVGSESPPARSARRDEVIDRLADRGVPAKAYMPCLHLLPQFRELGYSEGQFPVAEKAASGCLALPFHPDMEEASVERVIEALSASLGVGAGRTG